MGQWVIAGKHSEFTVYSGLLLLPVLSAGKVKWPVFKNELHVYLGCTGQSQELMMGIGPQPQKQRQRKGKKSWDTVQQETRQEAWQNLD